MYVELRCPAGLPGPNPTIASNNASVVNFYNATGSIVRFINKNIFFFYSKNALAYYNAGCIFENRRIGSRFWNLHVTAVNEVSSICSSQ
jgi:hypothetical protein